MESRLERLRRRQDAKQQRHDLWFRWLTDGLVASALLYLVLRSPIGRTWIAGAAQFFGRQ